MAQRRRVQPGYPVPPRPLSVAEADAYLAEEPLRCLLCGRRLKALGPHLAAIHALTPDAYRELYGLPYSVGLNAPSTRQLKARATAQQLQAEPRRLAAARALEAAARRPSERTSHYRRLRAVEQLTDLNGRPQGFAFGREHLQAFLARAASGRTFKEVARDPDMPSVTWVEGACRRWPERHAAFAAAVELLPFPLQARLGRLGPRFARAVAELHRRGLSQHAIARALGVDVMSVHKRVVALKRSGPAAEGAGREPGPAPVNPPSPGRPRLPRPARRPAGRPG